MARVAVVAGERRCRVRGRVRTVGADAQPSENEKIKLPLAHEIRARAMARALLRGASAGLDPLPGRREVQHAQSERNAGEGTVRAWGSRVVRLRLKPDWSHRYTMVVAISRTSCGCVAC